MTVNATPIASYSYDAADQVQGWTYDQAGNLQSDGTTTYSYDALNRLTGASATGQSRAYAYNGDGVLVSATANGTATTYAQDLAGGQSQVLAGTTGGVVTDYLYGLDRLGSLAVGTWAWYGLDGQGSVRQAFDAVGDPTGALNYDPFGTPESGTVAPFGYTGQLQDGTTGNEYLRARWYQPGNGSLLGVDPQLNSTGQPYAYAADDPVNGSDPGGAIAQFGWDCRGDNPEIAGAGFQGHDAAESFYLWYLGLNGYTTGTCEYPIPYANWTTDSGPRGTTDGRADVVEDYTGNGSKLWEFKPLYNLASPADITDAAAQAIWYYQRALTVHSQCSAGASRMVIRQGWPRTFTPLLWNQARYFTLSSDLTDSIGGFLVSPPIYTARSIQKYSTQYIYIVVLGTLPNIGGVAGFQIFRLRLSDKLRDRYYRDSSLRTQPVPVHVTRDELLADWDQYEGNSEWDLASTRAVAIDPSEIVNKAGQVGIAIVDGASAVVRELGGLLVAIFGIAGITSTQRGSA